MRCSADDLAWELFKIPGKDERVADKAHEWQRTNTSPSGNVVLIHSEISKNSSTRVFDEIDFQVSRAYIWQTRESVCLAGAMYLTGSLGPGNLAFFRYLIPAINSWGLWISTWPHHIFSPLRTCLQSDEGLSNLPGKRAEPFFFKYRRARPVSGCVEARWPHHDEEVWTATGEVFIGREDAPCRSGYWWRKALIIE